MWQILPQCANKNEWTKLDSQWQGYQHLFVVDKFYHFCLSISVTLDAALWLVDWMTLTDKKWWQDFQLCQLSMFVDRAGYNNPCLSVISDMAHKKRPSEEYFDPDKNKFIKRSTHFAQRKQFSTDLQVLNTSNSCRRITIIVYFLESYNFVNITTHPVSALYAFEMHTYKKLWFNLIVHNRSSFPVQ